MDNKELQQFGSYLDRTCEGITRRDLIKVGAVTFLGLTLPEFLALRADAAKAPNKKGKQARDLSVILLWMGGGPSHVDTFDPKPDADVAIKGPFEAIETNVDGIFLCEHLPLLAKQMDKMAILRSVTHGDGAHERAQHYLQTGYLPPADDGVSLLRRGHRAGKGHPEQPAALCHHARHDGGDERGLSGRLL